MREILFRGKRIDNSEWIYGSFCMDAVEQKNGLCGVDGFIRLYDFAKGKIQMHEVDRETVGQYTGLTDKNGKKIFEGDVLSYDFVGEDFATGEADIPQRDIFVVTWRDGKWDGWQMWERMTDHEREAFGFCDGDSINSKECRKMEVIGNIHDNPEFLEVPHE